jgi:hypothetical protein
MTTPGTRLLRPAWCASRGGWSVGRCAGSEHAACEAARAVRAAWSPGSTRHSSARSPSTGKSSSMMCSSGSAARSRSGRRSCPRPSMAPRTPSRWPRPGMSTRRGRAAAHRRRAAGQGQAVGGGGRPLQAPSLPGGAAVDTRDDPGLESGRGRRDRPGPRDLLRRSLAGSNGIPLRHRRRLVAGAIRIVRALSVVNCGTDGDTTVGKDSWGRGAGWATDLVTGFDPLPRRGCQSHKRISGVVRIDVCDLFAHSYVHRVLLTAVEISADVTARVGKRSIW